MAADKLLPGTITRYGALTYFALLLNTSSYLREVHFAGALSVAFALAVMLTYDLLFVSVALIPVAALGRLLDISRLDGLFARLPVSRKWIGYVLLVVVGIALQLLLYMDAFVYHLYGFHLNGFIWNLVFTSGGMESMGAGESTYASAAWLVMGFTALQTGLLALSVRSSIYRKAWDSWMTRRMAWILVAVFVSGCVFERVTYGLAHMSDYSPVVTAAPAFPFYIPLTFRKLANRMGYDARRTNTFKPKTDYLGIQYPEKPIRVAPDAKRLNIVWLACESLRADMLDPEIMPETWRLAQRSTWCTNHYSGGNGTRMGMFAMFYGLYGSYWFPFLAEKRSPVLMDLIQDRGYQLEIVTSASFGSPELNRTVFARVPQEMLHEGATGLGWQRDRQNVDHIEHFLDARKKEDPFFVFMFFESPHARYYFPPESVIRTEYTEEINYLKMDLAKDIGGMKNRYINASHHLDSQIQRLIEYLETNHLMDSTILLVTGDHGEEFMEHGRWGHGSNFSDEQTRVPLVLWMPGTAPQQITRMTSHVDLPATILTRLGVENPPADYSQGLDLLGKDEHAFVVVANWNNMAYVDAQYTAIFPTNSYQLSGQQVLTRDYVEIEDTRPFFESHKSSMLQIMKEMNRFAR